jgi:hypothetical protein
MKKSINATIFLMVVALASGCSGSGGPYNGHKVKWFMAHNSAMKKELKWCGNSENRMKFTECLNAGAAQNNGWMKATASGTGDSVFGVSK